MSFVVSAYTAFSIMEKQVRGVEIFDLTFFSSPLNGWELVCLQRQGFLLPV